MDNHSDTNTIPGRGICSIAMLRFKPRIQSHHSSDDTSGDRVGEAVGLPACFSGGDAGDQVAVNVVDQVVVEGLDQAGSRVLRVLKM